MSIQRAQSRNFMGGSRMSGASRMGMAGGGGGPSRLGAMRGPSGTNKDKDTNQVVVLVVELVSLLVLPHTPNVFLKKYLNFRL